MFSARMLRLPGSGELIEAAKRSLGVETDKQLAFVLWRDYGIEADQPQVSRWRREVRSPNFETTIVLLHAAGWLNEDRIRGVGGLAEAAAQARTAEERARDLASPEVPLRDEPKSV